MPKCRLARARICLRLRAKSFFVASMTTKSLPVFGARLEPLVQPEVLLGHLEHALLDEGHHAPRVRCVVAAREVRPGREDAQHVAVTRGEHPRHAGQNRHARQAGNIRESGRRRGLHAEERHEDRALAAEVHVRQVVVERAGLDGADRRTQRRLAREQTAAEARAPLEDHFVQHLVLLVRVGRHHRILHRQAKDGVEADEVRRKQHRASALQRGEVLFALDAHQAANALARAPPPDAALDDAAEEIAEVRARDALALGLGALREAFREIDARHLPPLGRQPVRERARCLADRRERAERQQADQPDEGNQEAAHAGAPLYRL